MDEIDTSLHLGSLNPEFNRSKRVRFSEQQEIWYFQKDQGLLRQIGEWYATKDHFVKKLQRPKDVIQDEREEVITGTQTQEPEESCAEEPEESCAELFNQLISKEEAILGVLATTGFTLGFTDFVDLDMGGLNTLYGGLRQLYYLKKQYDQCQSSDPAKLALFQTIYRLEDQIDSHCSLIDVDPKVAYLRDTVRPF